MLRSLAGLFDRKTGVILLLVAAFFLVFVVPLRTMFVELRLRRVPSKTGRKGEP
jgi:hypothetical protein